MGMINFLVQFFFLLERLLCIFSWNDDRNDVILLVLSQVCTSDINLGNEWRLAEELLQLLRSNKYSLRG